MSRNSNEDFDDILVEIAKKIYGKVVVDGLGKKLGFISADTDRYSEENAKQGGSHMGTLNMLRKWRQGQKKSEQRENLKAALEEAGLKEMADEYFSADDLGQGASSRPNDRGERHEEVEPDEGGYYTQPMKQAKPSKEQLDPKKNYKMDVLRKGRIFISNMTRRREGSEVDVANIKHVFKEIGFEIEPHSDLTAKGLIYELEKFVNSPCHEGMCSSVFLFMGHGSKTGIQCHDEQMVSTEFIRDKVSGMKYMNGKPKLIFFQSCRGGDDLERVERDQRETDMTIPAKSDVLMVHATTDGDAAYRSPVRGSWFIQMLCEELLKNAHDSDLSTMLDQVTGKLGNVVFTDKLKNYGQCPVVVKQGISKKIYFLPKYPPAETE